MSTDTDRVPMSPEALDLFAACVSQNVRDAAHVTNSLVDSLTADRDAANATLDAIRDRITSLLSGAYMPTSHALEAALWPSGVTIRAYMKEEAS